MINFRTIFRLGRDPCESHGHAFRFDHRYIHPSGVPMVYTLCRRCDTGCSEPDWNELSGPEKVTILASGDKFYDHLRLTAPFKEDFERRRKEIYGYG